MTASPLAPSCTAKALPRARRPWQVVRRVAAPATATVAVAALGLPWLRTGSTSRSAFRVVSALRAAGLMTASPAKAFFGGVALAPGVVAVSWLMAAARRPRPSAAAAALAGAIIVAVAVTVQHIAHHRAAYGTSAAAALGLATVVVAVYTISGPGARLMPGRDQRD